MPLYKGRTAWDSRVFPAATGSTGGSVTVTHDADGSKTISVGFSTRVYVYGPQEYGGSMTLTKIDRAAPSVTFSVSNITANGFTISASSSATCDIWQYSANGGGAWTTFSSNPASGASVTLSSLSPNTSYTVKVQARKQSNTVWGVSNTQTVKTLGGSILENVSAVTADAATVKISFAVTVYDASYKHKLEIKNGGSVYLALEGLTWTKGRTETAITLTAARRETLLTAMKSLKSFTGTFALTTYGGSSQIGAVSTKTAAVQTTAANSAPTLSGFTYADSNGATAAVTGNETVMIQGHSVLQVTPGTAAAKNFAEISGYTASCDGVNVSGTSGGALSLGSVSKSGQVTVTLTVTDTRGYTASASKTVTVVPYSPPKVSSLTLRRTNDIEAEMQLKFSGSISAVSVDGAAKNSLQTVRYRYKKTSESSYGSYVSVLSAVTKNGTSFDYSNLQLTNLDANSSYDFHIQIQDKLGTASSLDLYYVVPQGTPLIALRKQKVGVNNPNPAAALDVAGDVVISGAVTLGSIPHTAFKDTKKAAIMVEDLSEPGDYFFPLYSVKVKQGTWRVGVYSLQNKLVAVFTKPDGTYHWEPLVDGSTWV